MQTQLENSLRDLLHHYSLEIDFETDFLEKALSKEMILALVDGREIRGKLVKADKYRLLIIYNEQKWWFYKRSILGYTIVE